jgi:hypothetical protein
MSRRRRSLRAATIVAVDVPGALLALISGYLVTTTAAAWWARHQGGGQTPLPASPTHRFVVLVPAHDEERLIGSTVDSLRALDYPSNLVGVHVVADNCSDGTVAIARAHGAEVHERVAPDDPGKGPALQWLLDRLRSHGERPDAVVIVDADTTVNANFLRVMDAKLTEGHDAIQAYYAVRDAAATPTTAFRAAALAARHYLRPLGRTALGGSAGLYGNGMVFEADLLTEHGWSNHLTEDIELQLELLLDGTRVAFAPDAVVEAEMPATVDASRTQHQRWERGRLDMARRYAPRLFRQAVASRGADRFAAADTLADQLLPPFSIIVAATAAWSALAVARGVIGPRRSWSPVVVAVGLVGVQSAYVVSALKMVSAPPAVYRSLLGAPRLVAWKLRLWAEMVLRPGRATWIRTARNAPEPTPEAREASRTG